MEIREKIIELLESAEEVPEGDSRLDVLNQAVKLATMHQIEDLEYDAKFSYSEEAINSGRSERILQYIPWLLSWTDANPEDTSVESIIWLYKWAIITLSDFSRIDKSSILEAQIDLEKRMQAAFFPSYEILETRRLCHIALGNESEALATHEIMMAGNSGKNGDLWSDNDKIYSTGFFLEKTGQLQEAREALRPLLDLSYATDHQLLSRTLMLIPLAVLGESELAAEYCRQSLQAVEMTPYYVPCHGDLMGFLAITGNWKKGLDLFEKTVKASEENQLEMERATYYQGIIFLLESMLAAHQENFAIRLSSNHPLYNPEQRYQIAELLASYRERMQQIIDAFDKRNQNKFISQYYSRIRSITDRIAPFSI